MSANSGDHNPGKQVGQRCGSIMHLPADRVETFPLPSTDLPSSQSPDPNERGNVLHISLSEPHKATAQRRLDKGADVDPEGGGADNALQAANAEGHLDTLELPLEHGKTEPNKEVLRDGSKRIAPTESERNQDQVHSSALGRDANLPICERIASLVRSTHDPRKTFCVRLSWQVQQWFETELEGEPDLGPVLTITGSPLQAYATTCEQYVRWQWQSSGVEVLRTLGSAMNTGQGQSDHLSIRLGDTKGTPNMEHATAYVRPLETETVIMYAQTLAWLCANFRVPEAGKFRCSSIKVKRESNGIDIQLTGLVEIVADEVTSCWHNLLPGMVIATGFPVRTENETGLELPFRTMLDLGEILFSVDRSEVWEQDRKRLLQMLQSEEAWFDDDVLQTVETHVDNVGVLFGGEESLLFPVRHDRERRIIKWHYMKTSKHLNLLANQDWRLMEQQEHFDSFTHILD